MNIQDLENTKIEDLFTLLKKADDAYFNNVPIMEDSEYDIIYQYAKQAMPTHPYFIGVGAEVRGGKIKLPYPMGSLDQIAIGEIEKWVTKNSLELQHLVLTDKLDGVSAMIVYDSNGDLQIAYGRGDGTMGSDITRHIRKLPSVPKTIKDGPKAIRGEVIIKQANWNTISSLTKTRGGEKYKNLRNMVAGLINAKENSDNIYLMIDFVAYDIIDYEGIDKVNMLSDLETFGFLVPHHSFSKGHKLDDPTLAGYLNQRRDETEYEIDGIVIDVNLTHKRQQMNPTKDTLNPAYSVKYKVADSTNYAEPVVKHVDWKVSKHGYLKPVISIEPVDLKGVSVTKCTGFNAKFIYDNKIQPGCKISITRSGDVIPLITGVLSPGKLTDSDYDDWFNSNIKDQIGSVEYKWNDTNVDIVINSTTRDMSINQIVDFFSSIEAPYLKQGNIEILFDFGFASTDQIIRLSEQQLTSVIGENGKKIYNGLRKKLTNIPISVLMGSTMFFGRGVGKRKFKMLIKELRDRVFDATVNDIVQVEGFEEKTAHKIVNGMEKYKQWVTPLIDDQLIVINYDEFKTDTSTNDSPINGKVVVFTGFRSKEMQAQIEAKGGDVKNSISSKTNFLVTNNPNSTSSKIKKARELGIEILTPEEMEKLLR